MDSIKCGHGWSLMLLLVTRIQIMLCLTIRVKSTVLLDFPANYNHESGFRWHDNFDRILFGWTQPPIPIILRLWTSNTSKLISKTGMILIAREPTKIKVPWLIKLPIGGWMLGIRSIIGVGGYLPLPHTWSLILACKTLLKGMFQPFSCWSDPKNNLPLIQQS